MPAAGKGDQDPERAVEDLPRGAVKDSVRVFAEWLKENRRALQEQMAGMAARFEETDRDNKRRLEEIHRETRRTNGRVTDLENFRKLNQALEDGHQAWESGQEVKEREKREARDKLRDRLTIVGVGLLGLIGGGALHHFGL